MSETHFADDGNWDDFARAWHTLEGYPRDWSNQSGPALQTLALLQAFPLISTATHAAVPKLVAANVQFLLTVYQRPTRNLWKAESGYSFFAGSVQLRCC